ncbi:MAG: L,D-transpeptidase family protein, partial [Phycisphaeraceae bacterium]|nr:L,D-transpeptidase family protein [Phycisphaeraceae bacterium]
DYDCRIVAVDSDGTKHRPVSKSNTGNELRQCKATFNLALDNIKHFEFQARAYEWIEFRDIALVPHEREPEIRPNVQQAEAIIARLDVLFSSAYAALVFRDEPKRALEIIQAESPSLDQLLPKVKGTNMEQSVSMAIEAAHQTKQALGAGDLAKAKDLMPGILKAQRRLETLFLKKEAGGSPKVQTVRSRVLTLAEPQYEWWLAKSAKEISVAQGEPLTIEWSLREDLYDELEFLAVGVVPVGVDISENERYQWLANDIPITVRKTQYGKVWPVSYALMGKPNKEAEPLTPGNYRIMVFGFKSGGGEAVGDWRHILNNNLMCVAAAGLVVEPAAVNSVSPDRPTDKRLAIRNALNDRLTREDKAILKQEMSLISKEWLFSDKVLPGDTLCEHYSVKTGDSFWKIGEACKVPYTLILQINEIENANSIRSGQQIKVINGPFHAKVWSSTCKMDLYLQDMYVKTYDIGLGKPGQDTPTGQWVVKEAGKLRRPPWTDPDTGRRLIPDDPDYPLGEGYMALKGVQGDAVSRHGFGIHGTQDRAIIGQQNTSGTIAMLNADFLELFGLLKEETSIIEVAD